MSGRGPGLLLAVVLAALLGIQSAGPGSGAPPPFEPGGVMCVENLESSAQCDGDTTAGASTDIRVTFCIGWNADCTVQDHPVVESNFGGVVAFTPVEWGLPKGDTLPIGAIAGRLDSQATLGLLNNPCNNVIGVAFTLMNASINTGDTIAPWPSGDRMQSLAQDVDGNGVPDGADRYPTFLAEFFSMNGSPIQPRARLFGVSNIQGGWITLNFVFFEPGTTIKVDQTDITFDPALGYPSVTILQDPTVQPVPNAITDFCAPLFAQSLTLGKTLNNPCTPVRVPGANCPVMGFEPPEIRELGYPSFPCDARSRFDDDSDGKVNDGCPREGAAAEAGAECDNDVSDDPEDASVNDGCPAVGDISEGSRIPGDCAGGDEGGCTYRWNPDMEGTYTFTVLAVSQRDADGDGIENGLDVCFDKPNPEWDPRAVDVANDPDYDGLPSACDPQPNVLAPGSPGGCASGYTGADEDQDCYSNRADNCPLKVSLQNPLNPPDPITNKPYAPDTDHDGIGDACDPDPNAVNGEDIGYCLKFALNVGGAGGPVAGERDTTPAPECVSLQTSVYLGCRVVSSMRFEPGDFFGIPVIRSSTDIEVTSTNAASGWTVYFADRPGLGHLSSDRATMSAGKATVQYVVPFDLKEGGNDTISAAVYPISEPIGMSDAIAPGICSVTLRVELGPTSLPSTGGRSDDSTAGILATLGGGAIAVGGAGALTWAWRRRRTPV